MGGPIAALQFLAEHLLSRGRRLKAGDVVLTGMTTGIHHVVPGQRGRIEFSGAEACDIEVVAASPISAERLTASGGGRPTAVEAAGRIV